MTLQIPVALDSVFVAPRTPSFADLIARLERIGGIIPARQKDLQSGLRRVAAALDSDPARVPADPQWLQPRLARVAPAALGISAKTWQNSVSNARSAMVACGLITKRHRRSSDLSPAWAALWESVRASRDKSLLSPLPRFVFFLNRIGVAPGDVRSDHALLFLEAVKQNEISKAPTSAYKDAVGGWNRAVTRLPDWPRQPLEIISRDRQVKLPDAAYALGFIADLDRYLETRVNPDPLSEDENLLPITRSSAATYRYILLRFARHVMRSGVPVERIASLDDLIDPEHAEAGLRAMLELTKGKTSVSISDTAALLLTIAKHRGATEATRRALARFKDRLVVRDPGGMTAKNRERLRVLRRPQVLARLLRLPEDIYRRPIGIHRYKALRAWEEAIAIAILLYCPIRISNLSALEIDRHLHRPDRGRVYLVIPAGEVKNNRPLEFELPHPVVAMIDDQLATRAPTICAPDSLYLFPAGRNDCPVGSGNLADRIKRRIRTEIGIEMNAHLFRHLAVMIYLNANPGGYEVARQILGHASVSRTISVYSGLETIGATNAFAAVVDKLRDQD